MKKIVSLLLTFMLITVSYLNADDNYALFSNDDVKVSLQQTDSTEGASKYDIASTKVSCDKVEFNLNPTALIKAVIDNAIAEAMNGLSATEMTPDKMVDMIIDAVIGTVCLLQNPMEIQKQIQAGMACTGKLNPGSMDTGGNGGIANNYVYPVPSAAGTMKMNLDMSTMKAMGSCFGDVAKEFQACKKETEDPNCKFATCFYNMRKEFFDLLNTKIRTASYNKSSMGTIKQKQCEYKKKKNNKIFDAINMNAADQDSFISNFQSTLSEIGVYSEIGDNRAPDDLNAQEKEEYDAFMKKMAGNLTDTTFSNKLAKAIKSSDAAKLEACGEEMELVGGAIPAVTTMSSRNFNALDYQILDDSKMNFDITNIFDNNIGLDISDIKSAFFKLELYKYLMGFNEEEEFNDGGMITKSELTFINKTKLITAMDNNFLLLPSLSNPRLTPRNRMLLTNTFCKSLEGVEGDDEEFKTLIKDIYITNIKNNNYEDMCDFLECPEMISNINNLNSDIPLNYLISDKYVGDILGYIKNNVCPASIEIYNKMVSGDKIKNLVSINKSTLKRFIKTKVLREKNKNNTKKEDREDKADITILKKPNVMANNIKEVKRSWEEADSHIQGIMSETLYWGLKK